MKLHNTVVDKLIRIYDNYGGYRENTKLRTALNEVVLDIYQRENGEQILVDSQDLAKKSLEMKK